MTRDRLRRPLAVIAGGAAATLPLAGSAVAAPAVCACGGAGSSPPPPAPEEEAAETIAPEQVGAPAVPPPSRPAPPPAVPRTPDAAERWLEEEPEPAPPEPPARSVYGVEAEIYHHLPPEDQEAIRNSHEREQASEPEPRYRPEPEPQYQPEPPPAEPPAHPGLDVGAELRRRLPPADQEVVSESQEPDQAPLSEPVTVPATPTPSSVPTGTTVAGSPAQLAPAPPPTSPPDTTRPPFLVEHPPPPRGLPTPDELVEYYSEMATGMTADAAERWLECGRISPQHIGLSALEHTLSEPPPGAPDPEATWVT